TTRCSIARCCSSRRWNLRFSSLRNRAVVAAVRIRRRWHAGVLLRAAGLLAARVTLHVVDTVAVLRRALHPAEHLVSRRDLFLGGLRQRLAAAGRRVSRALVDDRAVLLVLWSTTGCDGEAES